MNKSELIAAMALKAGCDDFLSKPVSSEKCLQTIAKYIGK